MNESLTSRSVDRPGPLACLTPAFAMIDAPLVGGAERDPDARRHLPTKLDQLGRDIVGQLSEWLGLALIHCTGRQRYRRAGRSRCDMNEYIAGVFGLIGAVVGSGTTLIPPLINAHRADRSAHAAAEREAQVTALLLVDDLELARRRLRGAYRRDNARFWSADFALPLSTWAGSRADIAHNLPADVWDPVSLAFRELTEIERTASAHRSEDPTGRPELGPDDAAWLRRAVDKLLGPAITALTNFSKGQSAEFNSRFSAT